jgi:hypothetical protein
MAFCLIPKEADKFIEKLKDGSINPEKLVDMTSAERRAFFDEFMGEENAKEVNALFESKLLLKNQQQGMINWAKKVTGITREVRRDLITRIERLEKVLDPKEKEAFLQDLANKRLGVDVTYDEAKSIAELSQEISKYKEKWDEKTQSWPSQDDRLKYGAAKVALKDYVKEIKLESAKETIKEKILHPFRSVSQLAGISKSMVSTLDNSFLGRQGIKMFYTHPTVWAKGAGESFRSIWRSLKGEDATAAVEADILSRPNAMNGKYEKARLSIGNLEETFPELLPAKIPGLGRLFKASESAFTTAAYRMRADAFDLITKIADETGVNTADKFELESIGKLVNSMTGRGNLGGLESAGPTVNKVFFSPKFFKSNIDTLTLHAFEKGGMSSFARKQAAVNLVKIISGIGAILMLFKTLDPDSVDLDPRSSDFGKIRVGNTRFDITGGMSSLVVLAARLITQETKSSTTGKVTKLGEKYGSPTGSTLLGGLLENKLAPTAQVFLNWANRKDRDGNPITPFGVLKTLYAPLPVTNLIQSLSQPSAANILLILIADGLGFSANTYGGK